MTKIELATIKKYSLLCSFCLKCKWFFKNFTFSVYTGNFIVLFQTPKHPIKWPTDNTGQNVWLSALNFLIEILRQIVFLEVLKLLFHKKQLWNIFYKNFNCWLNCFFCNSKILILPLLFLSVNGQMGIFLEF